jgi:hypothetical protein
MSSKKTTKPTLNFWWVAFVLGQTIAFLLEMSTEVVRFVTGVFGLEAKILATFCDKTAYSSLRRKFMKKLLLPAALLVAITACSAEQQNQIRRDVLNLANQRHYITVYSLNGTQVMRGDVDGKVTRAESGQGQGTGGEYVYWFDPSGKYYQTNMPYIVTTDPNRTGIAK